MRKRWCLILIAVIAISGCSNIKKLKEETYKLYQEYMDLIFENKENESSNIPFEHSMEVIQASDGTYHYVITIDQPKTAMYQIQMMAVDKTLDSTKVVYPTIGLLGEDGDDSIQMVPNQVNVDKNYVAGVQLEGVSEKPDFRLNVMVVWKDYENLMTYKVFFNEDSPEFVAPDTADFNLADREQGTVEEQQESTGSETDEDANES